MVNDEPLQKMPKEGVRHRGTGRAGAHPNMSRLDAMLRARLMSLPR
jgi:hypothetical protein